MKNIIYSVGFGSGERDYMTEQAIEVIENADVIVGYTTYIDILKKSFPEKRYISTPMRKEEERCRIAVEEALKGKKTAVVSSGDSGIYGMAGILHEIIAEMNAELDVQTVAGVTAASISAAALGAPLMHDFAVISLSDLMTPLELIYKRVECAAQSDFVICLYNPKSKKRTEQLKHTAELVMKYRSGATPSGIVRNAGRAEQTVNITTLSELKNQPVDMFCTVIIGNSQTTVKNGKMITPRGYVLTEGK